MNHQGFNWRNVRIALVTLVVAVGIALIVMIAPLPYALWQISRDPAPPSDDSLIRNFVMHRTSFESLLTMANEDHEFFRIASDFTSPENLSMSRARFFEYKIKFWRLGLTNGVTNESKECLFTAYTWGLAVGGLTKGYAYSKHTPTPLLPTLDNIRRSTQSKDGIGYRRISGNWYLYEEWGG